MELVFKKICSEKVPPGFSPLFSIKAFQLRKGNHTLRYNMGRKVNLKCPKLRHTDRSNGKR